MRIVSKLPCGVGLGLRASFAKELLASTTTHARFVEIAPENYMGVGGARARILDRARERFAVSVHGLCSDFAGSAPIDDASASALASLLDHVGAPFFSDHLCFTHLAGAEAHDLVPLPHNAEAIERVAQRIRTLRERLGRPIAIENISATFRTPGATMDEGQFVRTILEEADCGLLLDVNNVWVNGKNFGFDPDAFIAQLPMERVMEVHVAGAEWDATADCYVDTHGTETPDSVLQLLSRTLERIGRPVPVLLERDHDIPSLEVLDDEVKRIQAIVDLANQHQAA